MRHPPCHIAFRELNPEERRQAGDILKNHPSYDKWAKEAPENDAGLEEGSVLFMGASRWPDEIKSGSSSWNHKEWHYVDYPLAPPDFAIRPSPAPGDDIVFAIDLCVRKLKDSTASARDRACWLAWLIHLVCDITQPLHCCTLENEDFKAPEGDRGGNLVFVRAGSGLGVPLHKMWDDALGTSKGFHAKILRGYVNQATQLGSEFNRENLVELQEHTTPASWARESWQVAVDQVYLRGQLPYGKNAETAPLLPDGYTKSLKGTAQRRVAIAGYRLADLIRKVLKPSNQ